MSLLELAGQPEQQRLLTGPSDKLQADGETA
jgi:hypothetical protein